MSITITKTTNTFSPNNKMEVVQYTEKSIAVFGETKPWAVDLGRLGGGKYNANLRGRPGWIFSNKRANDVVNFVTLANSGQIQPTQKQQAVITPMVPFGATQTAFTPQAAMTQLGVSPQISPFHQTTTIPTITPLKLNIAPKSPFPGPVPTSPGVMQPITPFPPTNIGQMAPTATIPQMAPIAPKPQLQIRPIVALPTQPQQVSFPNTFIAGDNVRYQVVIYTIPLPQMHQEIRIVFDGTAINAKVIAVEGVSPPFDSVKIERTDENENVELDKELLLVVINGKWQIHGVVNEHEINFLPMEEQ